jgi:hypothetical protein
MASPSRGSKQPVSNQEQVTLAEPRLFDTSDDDDIGMTASPRANSPSTEEGGASEAAAGNRQVFLALAPGARTDGVESEAAEPDEQLFLALASESKQARRQKPLVLSERRWSSRGSIAL